MSNDPRHVGNYPSTSNLLTANQFRFNTSRIPILSEYVTGVNVPSIEFISADLNTAFGVNIPTATGKYIFEDLTVSFLVDEKLESWREALTSYLRAWLRFRGSSMVKGKCLKHWSTRRLYCSGSTLETKGKIGFLEYPKNSCTPYMLRKIPIACIPNPIMVNPTPIW